MKRPDESVMNNMSIKKWGAMFEILTTVEEIGELLVELDNAEPNVYELLGELADVSIMMGQLSAVFGVDDVDDQYMSQAEAANPDPIIAACGDLLSGLNKYNRARIGASAMCHKIAKLKHSIERKLAELQKEFPILNITEAYEKRRENKLDKLWRHLQHTPEGKGLTYL